MPRCGLFTRIVLYYKNHAQKIGPQIYYTEAQSTLWLDIWCKCVSELVPACGCFTVLFHIVVPVIRADSRQCESLLLGSSGGEKILS